MTKGIPIGVDRITFEEIDRRTHEVQEDLKSINMIEQPVNTETTGAPPDRKVNMIEQPLQIGDTIAPDAPEPGISLYNMYPENSIVRTSAGRVLLSNVNSASIAPDCTPAFLLERHNLPSGQPGGFLSDEEINYLISRNQSDKPLGYFFGYRWWVTRNSQYDYITIYTSSQQWAVNILTPYAEDGTELLSVAGQTYTFEFYSQLAMSSSLKANVNNRASAMITIEDDDDGYVTNLRVPPDNSIPIDDIQALINDRAPIMTLMQNRYNQGGTIYRVPEDHIGSPAPNELTGDDLLNAEVYKYSLTYTPTQSGKHMHLCSCLFANRDPYNYPFNIPIGTSDEVNRQMVLNATLLPKLYVGNDVHELYTDKAFPDNQTYQDFIANGGGVDVGETEHEIPDDKNVINVDLRRGTTGLPTDFESRNLYAFPSLTNLSMQYAWSNGAINTKRYATTIRTKTYGYLYEIRDAINLFRPTTNASGSGDIDITKTVQDCQFLYSTTGAILSTPSTTMLSSKAIYDYNAEVVENGGEFLTEIERANFTNSYSNYGFQRTWSITAAAPLGVSDVTVGNTTSNPTGGSCQCFILVPTTADGNKITAVAGQTYTFQAYVNGLFLREQNPAEIVVTHVYEQDIIETLRATVNASSSEAKTMLARTLKENPGAVTTNDIGFATYSQSGVVSYTGKTHKISIKFTPTVDGQDMYFVIAMYDNRQDISTPITLFTAAEVAAGLREATIRLRVMCPKLYIEDRDVETQMNYTNTVFKTLTEYNEYFTVSDEQEINNTSSGTGISIVNQNEELKNVISENDWTQIDAFLRQYGGTNGIAYFGTTSSSLTTLTRSAQKNIITNENLGTHIHLLTPTTQQVPASTEQITSIAGLSYTFKGIFRTYNLFDPSNDFKVYIMLCYDLSLANLLAATSTGQTKEQQSIMKSLLLNKLNSGDSNMIVKEVDFNSPQVSTYTPMNLTIRTTTTGDPLTLVCAAFTSLKSSDMPKTIINYPTGTGGYYSFSTTLTVYFSMLSVNSNLLWSGYGFPTLEEYNEYANITNNPVEEDTSIVTRIEYTAADILSLDNTKNWRLPRSLRRYLQFVPQDTIVGYNQRSSTEEITPLSYMHAFLYVPRADNGEELKTIDGTDYTIEVFGASFAYFNRSVTGTNSPVRTFLCRDSSVINMLLNDSNTPSDKLTKFKNWAATQPASSQINILHGSQTDSNLYNNIPSIARTTRTFTADRTGESMRFMIVLVYDDGDVNIGQQIDSSYYMGVMNFCPTLKVGTTLISGDKSIYIIDTYTDYDDYNGYVDEYDEDKDMSHNLPVSTNFIDVQLDRGTQAQEISSDYTATDLKAMNDTYNFLDEIDKDYLDFIADTRPNLTVGRTQRIKGQEQTDLTYAFAGYFIPRTDTGEELTTIANVEYTFTVYISIYAYAPTASEVASPYMVIGIDNEMIDFLVDDSFNDQVKFEYITTQQNDNTIRTPQSDSTVSLTDANIYQSATMRKYTWKYTPRIDGESLRIAMYGLIPQADILGTTSDWYFGYNYAFPSLQFGDDETVRYSVDTYYNWDEYEKNVNRYFDWLAGLTSRYVLEKDCIDSAMFTLQQFGNEQEYYRQENIIKDMNVDPLNIYGADIDISSAYFDLDELAFLTGGTYRSNDNEDLSQIVRNLINYNNIDENGNVTVAKQYTIDRTFGLMYNQHGLYGNYFSRSNTGTYALHLFMQNMVKPALDAGREDLRQTYDNYQKAVSEGLFGGTVPIGSTFGVYTMSGNETIPNNTMALYSLRILSPQFYQEGYNSNPSKGIAGRTYQASIAIDNYTERVENGVTLSYTNEPIMHTIFVYDRDLASYIITNKNLTVLDATDTDFRLYLNRRIIADDWEIKVDVEQRKIASSRQNARFFTIELTTDEDNQNLNFFVLHYHLNDTGSPVLISNSVCDVYLPTIKFKEANERMASFVPYSYINDRQYQESSEFGQPLDSNTQEQYSTQYSGTEPQKKLFKTTLYTDTYVGADIDKQYKVEMPVCWAQINNYTLNNSFNNEDVTIFARDSYIRRLPALTINKLIEREEKE